MQKRKINAANIEMKRSHYKEYLSSEVGTEHEFSEELSDGGERNEIISRQKNT